MLVWIAVVLGLLLVGALVWGWFEAGWLRHRVVDVELEGLPPELDGLRIAHLSDLHLGARSRGDRAVEAAVDWVVERAPDLVCLTGDLVSRRRGLSRLEQVLRRLDGCFVILGNHDLAESRDPFSQRIEPAAIRAIPGVIFLEDDAVGVEIRGRRVQIVGVAPHSYMRGEATPAGQVDPEAALRILLCHFPKIARRLPVGSFQLVLAGHLHSGQIVLPFPGGKLRLAHPRAREVEGLYRYGSTVLHVSPGLGTTFVPLRFFARPEVTELVLRTGIR